MLRDKRYFFRKWISNKEILLDIDSNNSREIKASNVNDIIKEAKNKKRRSES